MMKALRVLVLSGSLVLAVVGLAAMKGWLAVPIGSLFGVLCVLNFTRMVLDWKQRKDHPRKEPTPAQSIRNVILATGLVAAIVTSRGAHSARDFLVPAVIALASLIMAWLAYRLAEKHTDRIGEARFDTTANKD